MRDLARDELARAWRSKWWLHVRPRYAAVFQLRQERLVMPWPHFCSAVDAVLGRDVGRREFARENRRALLAEVGHALAADPYDHHDLDSAEAHVVAYLDRLGVLPGAVAAGDANV